MTPVSRNKNVTSKLLALLFSALLAFNTAHAQDAALPPAEQVEPNIDPDAERREQFFATGIDEDSGQARDITADGPPRSLDLSPLLSDDIDEKFGIIPDLDDSAAQDDKARPPDQKPDEETVSLIPENVLIAELSDWDVASTGILNEALGGLSADIWEDLHIEDVMSGFGELSTDAKSFVAQNLLSRLLLTAATPPQGSEENGWEFVQSRLELIAARGDLEGLLAMLDALPRLQGPQNLEPLRFESYLLAGDLYSACEVVKRQLSIAATPQWLEGDIACRAFNGDHAGARLALDVLKETQFLDAFFEQLVVSLRSENQRSLRPVELLSWPLDVEPTPLLFALGQANGLAPLVAEDSQLLMHMALASSAGSTMWDRLVAVEKIANKSRLDASHLLAISLNLRLDQIDQDIKETYPNLIARLSSFQLAATTEDPALKLAALRDLWQNAERDGVFLAWAFASRDLVVSLEPTVSFAGAAPEVVRVLSLIGASQQVSDWYHMVRESSSPEIVGPVNAAIATNALLEIWPLALIQDKQARVPFSSRIVELWWQHQSNTSGGIRAHKALLLFHLLDAFNYDVAAENWALLDGAGAGLPLPVLDEAKWSDFKRAVEDEQEGAVILGALSVLGSDHVSEIAPNELREIIVGLDTVGFENEARMLAAEALILTSP